MMIYFLLTIFAFPIPDAKLLNSPSFYDSLYQTSILYGEDSAFQIFAGLYALKSPLSRLTDTSSVRALLSISENILVVLPESSIYISNGDNDTYPFWYLQKVKGIRKDVLIINRNLWNLKEYRTHLWETTPVRTVISLDSLLSIKDTIIYGRRFVDLSMIAHRLAGKYPVFATGCSPPEFPEDSLYDALPVMAMFYSPVPITGDSIARFNYSMVSKQDYSFITYHPPFDSEEEYENTRAINLPNIPVNVALVLIENEDTVNVKEVFKRFDKWLSWNPYYLVFRAVCAKKIGEDDKIWFEKVHRWLLDNPGHWASGDVKKLLEHYENY